MSYEVSDLDNYSLYLSCSHCALVLTSKGLSITEIAKDELICTKITLTYELIEVGDFRLKFQ